MAHPGRARVNAISTALPDSQLRLGEWWRGGGEERKEGGVREQERRSLRWLLVGCGMDRSCEGKLNRGARLVLQTPC